MLEFILDFIFDLVLEGSVIMMSEKKVPMPIRIIAFIIVVLLYLGISGVCMYAGVMSALDRDIIVALIFFAIGLFVLIGGFFQMRKELKNRNKGDHMYE